MYTAESSSAQQTFEQIEQELGAGMVPRIFKLLESQPLLLAHLWGQFRAIVLQGHLPRVLKELLGLMVARATHCEYVQVVHLHSLTLQNVDRQALASVSQGDYEAVELSDLTKAALRFAALATTTRAAYSSSVESQDTWQKLREQTAQALAATALEEEEKFELAATVALFEQICAIANLLELDPNQP
jgi:AhpD family alkylhydroperoxidase